MDDDNELQVGEIILQLLSSIRVLDGRISEIKYGIINGFFTPAGEIVMKEKIQTLIETRMKLIFSLQDNRLAFNKYIGEQTKISYKNLKREI